MRMQEIKTQYVKRDLNKKYFLRSNECLNFKHVDYNYKLIHHQTWRSKKNKTEEPFSLQDDEKIDMTDKNYNIN